MPFQNNIEFNQYINSGANEKGFAANSNVKIFSNSANQGGTRVPINKPRKPPSFELGAGGK